MEHSPQIAKNGIDVQAIDARGWWRELVAPEIPKDLSPAIERRTRLTARFTLVALLANVVFFCNDLLLIGDPIIIGLDLVAISFFGWVHFNYVRKVDQRSTAIWLLTALNIWLFFNGSYYGREGMIFLFLYTLILVTFILIDLNERVLLVPFMALPVLSLVILEATDYRWFNNPGLSRQMIEQTRLLSMITNIVLLCVFMDGIVRQTLDNEKRLMDRQLRLQQMTMGLQELNSLKEEYNHSLELRLRTVLKEMREKERALDHAAIEGEERERQRIAQDLHDGVGALLSTLKLRLGNFHHLVMEGQREDYLGTMELIDTACEEVRQASHRLQPLLFAELGLANILHDLIEKINSSGRMKVTMLDAGYTEHLDTEGERSLYRIILELINNAMRHSNAETLSIQFMSREDRVVLTVEEDGRGYDPGSVEIGLGLNGIQHRVDCLNGELHIETSTGCGVVTIVDVPLDRRPADRTTP